jgi:nucleoside-diphosphate-sugar epimerase
MKKNIFIFGANSILANNLIIKDIKNWNKIGFYRNKLEPETSSRLISKYQINLSEELTKKDLNNLNKMSLSLPKDRKNIFVLYAWSGTHRSSLNDHKKIIWNSNEYIIKNFIKICKILKPYQIVFLSSADPLYKQNSTIPSKESDQLKPSSPYGHQKIWAEKILEFFAIKNNINLTVFRIAPAFGFDSRFRDQGVLNKWLIAAYKSKELTVYNSLDSEINFISFEHISEAILNSIEKEVFGTFNLGSIASSKLKFIKDLVSKVTNKKDLKINYISNSKKLFFLDTSLFYKKSGLQFPVSLENEAFKIYSKIKETL